MSTLDKLNEHYRRWGWWRTCYAVVMRFAEKMLGLEVFVVRVSEAPEAGETVGSSMPDVALNRISDKELFSLADDATLPMRGDFIRAAIDRGDLAYGATYKDELIAYVWRSTATAPHYDDCWVRVERPFSYSYNSYTKPEYRGQRLVPTLLMFSDQKMRELGCTHRVGIVAVANFASLNMRKHMRSQNIGHAGFVRFFGRYFFFRTRPVAEIGLRLYQPSRQ